MSNDIANRLAALESRLAEFLPAEIERRPHRMQPAGWIMDKVRARADMRRAAAEAASCSFPVAAAIRVFGEIDAAMADKVRDELEAAPLVRELHVIIDSEGGSYADAIRIYRSIKWHSATTKRAYLKRNCISAGALVAMAADHRVAQPDTVLWLHLVATVPDLRDRWTVDRLVEEARRIRTLDDEMMNIFADATGCDLATLIDEASIDRPMDLKRALDLGLIHEVSP